MFKQSVVKRNQTTNCSSRGCLYHFLILLSWLCERHRSLQCRHGAAALTYGWVTHMPACQTSPLHTIWCVWHSFVARLHPEEGCTDSGMWRWRQLETPCLGSPPKPLPLSSSSSENHPNDDNERHCTTTYKHPYTQRKSIWPSLNCSVFQYWLHNLLFSNKVMKQKKKHNLIHKSGYILYIYDTFYFYLHSMRI